MNLLSKIRALFRAPEPLRGARRYLGERERRLAADRRDFVYIDTDMPADEIERRMAKIFGRRS